MIYPPSDQKIGQKWEPTPAQSQRHDFFSTGLFEEMKSTTGETDRQRNQIFRGENVLPDYPFLQQANLSQCFSYSAKEFSFPKSKHSFTRSSFRQEACHLDDPDHLKKIAHLVKKSIFSTKNLLPWKD